jgi:hypothetical protein
MDSESVMLRLIGTKRLIMHSGRLADPLDEASKALSRLTGKKMRTEADHEEIARVEWHGSLWLDGGRPCIPSEALMATAVGAARSRKRGPAARAGLVVEHNAILNYQGPADMDMLWQNPAFRLRTAVRIRGSRTMRTRPLFDDWSVEFTVHYLPTLIDRDEVVDLYRIAGFTQGLGDWRPVNGTFEVR